MFGLRGFTETVTGVDGLFKIEALVGNMLASSERLLSRTHLVDATAGSFIVNLGGGFGDAEPICCVHGCIVG